MTVESFFRKVNKGIDTVLSAVNMIPIIGDPQRSMRPVLDSRAPKKITEKPGYKTNVYYRPGDQFPESCKHVQVSLVPRHHKQHYYNLNYSLPLLDTIFIDDRYTNNRANREHLNNCVSELKSFISMNSDKTFVLPDVAAKMTEVRYGEIVRCFSGISNCYLPEEWEQFL